MSDIYYQEHLNNTRRKPGNRPATDDFLRDIGSQLSHIADELKKLNEKGVTDADN